MAMDLSTNQSVIVVLLILGCFTVIWPKIFVPMFHASMSPLSRSAKGRLDVDKPHIHPAMLNPNIRAAIRSGDPGTIRKKETTRNYRVPSARQQTVSLKEQGFGGLMSFLMPVYTIAIIMFFGYTILKYLSKNEEPEETDADAPRQRKTFELMDVKRHLKYQGYLDCERKLRELELMAAMCRPKAGTKHRVMDDNVLKSVWLFAKAFDDIREEAGPGRDYQPRTQSMQREESVGQVQSESFCVDGKAREETAPEVAETEFDERTSDEEENDDEFLDAVNEECDNDLDTQSDLCQGEDQVAEQADEISELMESKYFKSSTSEE